MTSLTVILKQTIYAALVKCATPAPDVVLPVYDTPEGARDAFIASVMAELFPEHGGASAVVDIPVHVALPATKADKAAAKAAALSAKEEAKVAAAAKKEALAAAKAAKEEAARVAKAAKEEAAAAKAAAKAAAPPKSPPKSPEDKAAEKAAKAAAKAAAPKPAPKVPEGANIPKLDPTFRKALKEGDPAKAKSLEASFLTHLNSMSNIMFNDKGAKEHVVAFLASLAAVGAGAGPASPPQVPVDLEVVEFQGRDWYVDPATKRVYEGVTDLDGVLSVTKPVGYVGMADFKDMVLEDE